MSAAELEKLFPEPHALGFYSEENYKDGILHIHVPKKEPAKPKLLKEIAVA